MGTGDDMDKSDRFDGFGEHLVRQVVMLSARSWKLQLCTILAAAAVSACIPAAAGAQVSLTQPELRCQTNLARASSKFALKDLKARQRCYRSVLRGKLSRMVDCSGDPDTLADPATHRRLNAAAVQLQNHVINACSGLDLTNLEFPGPCADADGPPFSAINLAACVQSEVSKIDVELLAVQHPGVLGFIGRQALRCSNVIERVSRKMLIGELDARQACLLKEDRGGFAFNPAVDCREQVVPYGAGTDDAGTDQAILSRYKGLLANVPSACATTNVAALQYDDDCVDTTGGTFNAFDLELCLFDSHRLAGPRLLNLSFPRPPECGNGILEGDEQCDDGNTNNNDGCIITNPGGDPDPTPVTGNCILATCGDGYACTAADCTTGPGGGQEACDDGNTTNTDACLNDCRLATCGDGVTETGVEECDDGNSNDADQCRNSCKLATCGDGVTCTSLNCTSGGSGGPEDCDDGNQINCDGCSSSCALEFCGDGVVCTQLGEQCDDGLAGNSDSTPDACRTSCKDPFCGDGVTDTGEECDGSVNCGPDCTVINCGNGVKDPGEECDDGANNSDTQPDACRENCTLPRCGDGVTDTGEACDDGNANGNQPDACRSTCVLPSCGDGVTDTGEQCDDGAGNANAPDACRPGCIAPTCGDGIRDPGSGEQCDDGNANDNDQCTLACNDAVCGDGILCSAAACTTGPGGGVEQCDDGADNGNQPDACRATCALPSCGDGVTDTGEGCDDGAGNSDTTPNACRTDCTPAACGDDVVDSGEQCDGTSNPCQAPTPGCGSDCTCVNQCPGLGELTLYAGVGRECTSNADCEVGTCDGSRCRTKTRLDTGWTGLGHEADITDGVILRSFLECDGEFPCGECQVGAIDPANRNCRCANDNTKICTQPFEVDDTTCGGTLCNCYFGPPLALSSGNVPACVVNRFVASPSGTVNVDEGSGAITARLRSVVYLGESLFEPCPYCEGDVTPDDGIRNGTCHLGQNAGMPCDANGFNTTFPAPGGGDNSIDCFPDIGKNVSGSGLRISLTQTTGAAEPIGLGIECGFPLIGINQNCHCGVCSMDPSLSTPCSSNADCQIVNDQGQPQDLGVCQKRANLDPSPNQCRSSQCVEQPDGSGLCDDMGPTDRYCDGIIRAGGDGFLQCNSNADCAVGAIGVDAGNCTLTKRRDCFPAVITAEGKPDPMTPLGAATFCVPPTGNGGINTAAGLPGPGRVLNQAASRLFCASDPQKIYTPGVGGCD